MDDSHKQSLIVWLIALALALGTFLGMLCGRGDYSAHGFIDALFVGGGISALLGLLAFIVNLGFFDSLSYGFINMFYWRTPVQKKPKYQDYGDYVEQKREQRRERKTPFWPFWVLGGVMILISLILEAIYYWAI